jgi:hypothetical protein
MSQHSLLSSIQHFFVELSSSLESVEPDEIKELKIETARKLVENKVLEFYSTTNTSLTTPATTESLQELEKLKQELTGVDDTLKRTLDGLRQFMVKDISSSNNNNTNGNQTR